MNALENGNRTEVNVLLKQFKTESGMVAFDKLLSVPKECRLPELNKSNPTRLLILITGALTVAFESMNLKRHITESQIVDLAETIIDSSIEDYLSLEDILIFLQKFIRGEYGSNYESMDIPKFMEKLEVYRQERHEKYIRIMADRESNYKIQGDSTRSNSVDELSQHFSGMAEKITVLNSELKYQRNVNQQLNEENKNLKKNIPKD